MGVTGLFDSINYCRKREPAFMTRILVIDDRIDIRLSLTMLLNDNDYQPQEAESLDAGKKALACFDFSLVLLDMNYALDTTSGEEGLSFLSWMKSKDISIPVIAMTAWSNVELAVKAMQLGATDFIEKPWKNKRLLQVISQQLAYQKLQSQNIKLKQQLKQAPKSEYIWRSDCMLSLMEEIKTVANTDVSILLTGDNGTGKSELASYIHQLSPRKAEALISVNMGSISESLFESEMFGHKKGAFTDARSRRIGRFELAEQGSLFLDEIANISLSQQAKLLRVLESGEYEILGSSQTCQTDIRIISATNGDINQLIQQELFREDLYYRLNTIEFCVPSLKDRRLDIIPLTEFFIKKYAHQYHRSEFSLSHSAQQALMDYHWPGNIRELNHLIERAVLLAKGEEIGLDDLHLSNKPDNQEFPLMTLEAAEIKLIKTVLDKTAQNVPKAAEVLGLTKSSLYRRIDKFGLSI